MTSLKASLAKTVNCLIAFAGVEICPVGTWQKAHQTENTDTDPWILEIIQRVKPYTMTSEARISALCHATRYLVRNGIPGDIVECGVWRGGSMMAVALTLMREDEFRPLHLFDTFTGMPQPSEFDRTVREGLHASEVQAAASLDADGWCSASLQEVISNVESTGYPTKNLHYVEGDVLETIPSKAPNKIALLRLDTDWYNSTKHELNSLYQRLTPNGVLIIDDYGHWDGARRAVNEFFEERQINLLLSSIDYTGRIAIKPAKLS